MIEWLLLGYGVYRVLKGRTPPAPPAVPPPCAPRSLISFIGITNAGKSSTINALLGRTEREVGVEQGTTRGSEDCEYVGGYWLRDTPGFMDVQDYTHHIFMAVQWSEVVAFTVTDDLFERERATLEWIAAWQRHFDGPRTTRRRQLILWVNKGDEAETLLTKEECQQRRELISSRVAPWISREHIAFGSAAIVRNGQRQGSDVDELRRLLHSILKLDERSH